MIGLASVVAMLLLIGCASAPVPHPVTYQSYPAAQSQPPAKDRAVKDRARSQHRAPPAALIETPAPPGAPEAAGAADPVPCVTQSSGATVISRDSGCR